MIDILFPKSADNKYYGYKLTKWVLYLYIFKSFLAGAIHMFTSDGGAQRIASITLDTFTQGGADSVVTMFGLWGMEQMVIGVIALIIVLRYQSLIPFLWGIYSLEYFGRKAAHFFTPGLATAHTPPGAVIDNVLLPLALIMFALALFSSANSKKTMDNRQTKN